MESMTKVLLFISIGIIIYLLLQPNSNAPLDQTESATSAPVVSDPIVVEAPPAVTSEEIQDLPVQENVEPLETQKKKSGVGGLKLIGTIYGAENASAMLADANNKTFVVKLNQKVLKSEYLVTRIDKDRIYLRKDNKNFVLVMNKAR